MCCVHFNRRDKNDSPRSTDEQEAEHDGLNPLLVTAKIAALIRQERYKYIFVDLPRATTHGYHQAAALLTAAAIQSLPQNLHPVLLGFDTDASNFIPPSIVQKTQRWESVASYAFDRTSTFGYHNALSYQIVVNWMIAEHKSQGLLQTWENKDPKEYIWIDSSSTPQAQSLAGSLFQSLGTSAERNP
jgi:hypothetical protein